MKNRFKINPPIELTPESDRKAEMAKRKRQLEGAIAEGMKGPFYPFSIKQFLKEMHKKHPEFSK